MRTRRSCSLLILVKKTPQLGFPPGALMDLPVSDANFHLVARKDFEKIVFAVLLGEEKPRPVCLKYSAPD